MGCEFNADYTLPTYGDMAKGGYLGGLDLARDAYNGTVALPGKIKASWDAFSDASGKAIDEQKQRAAEKLDNARSKAAEAGDEYRKAAAEAIDAKVQIVMDNARYVQHGVNKRVDYVVDNARAAGNAVADGYNASTQFVMDSARAAGSYIYDKYDVINQGIRNLDPNLVSVDLAVIAGSVVGTSAFAVHTKEAADKKDYKGVALNGLGTAACAGAGAYGIVALSNKTWAIGRAAQEVANEGYLDSVRRAVFG